MSGDTQPKKRKDKKRRKEDEGSPFQPSIPVLSNNHSTNNTNDDVNIHVHKEGGLGGGICAKLVFFVLFSALAVLIGLIITEHRGLTDIDVVDTNSKFSQIFEGWTDSNVDHHEDENDIPDTLSEEHEGHEEEPEADTSEPEEDTHDDEEEHDEDEHDEDEEDEERSMDDDEGSDEKEKDEDEIEISRELSDEVDKDEDEDQSDEMDKDVLESEENDLDDDDDNKKSEEDNDDKTEEREEDLSREREDDDEADEDDTDKYNEDDDEDRDNNDGEKYDEIERENSAEENVSDETDGLDRSDENEEEYERKMNKEDDEDVDEVYEKDEEIVREARSYEAKSGEKTKLDEDEDDGNNAEDDEQPEVSTNREPDEDAQESSGSVARADDGSGETSTGYVNKNVTNEDDFKIRQEIDDAQNSIENNPAHAVILFDKILEKFPSSPRSIYGKAIALNRLADQKRSNEILYRAIQLYTKLLKTAEVPDVLFQEAVETTIKVMRFVGQYRNVIEIHKLAINRFPENPKYQNELAVTYLTINSISKARSVLKNVLDKWPNNGFALVHQGFILKTADNRLEDAVHFLRKGIDTNETGVIDGRFYFHLGDALERLGRHEEAMKVYEEGTKNKVFLSKYQRSLYNVPRLTGKPFWEQHDLPYFDLFRSLKHHWRNIRKEGLSALNEKGYFQDESENLRDTGEWKQFELFARGQKNGRNCAKSPITCGLIEQIAEAKGCKRGQTKFSVIHPGTHVWPHCGPTNCRLRVHLGLKVPPKTYLRVGDETRSWKEGEIIIFDDSFEHEVWHNGTDFRLVLIVDVWHPELTSTEKRNLSPI